MNFFGDKRFWYAIVAVIVVVIVAAVFGHATSPWNLLRQRRQIHRRLPRRLRQQQRRQNSNVGYLPLHRPHVRPARFCFE